MTQYYTDFSSYSPGDITSQGWSAQWASFPSGSAEVVTDAGATGGKALEVLLGSGARRALIWDAISADSGRGIVDVIVRGKASNYSTSNTNPRFGPLARAAGSASSETGYVFALRATAGAGPSLLRYVSGAVTTPSSLIGPDAPAANTYQFARMQIENGATFPILRFKTWQGAIGDEPASWDREYQDTASGHISQTSGDRKVGIYFFQASVTYTIDWIGVGTNGDSAPTEPVSGGTEITGSVTVTGSVSLSTELTLSHTSQITAVGSPSLARYQELLRSLSYSGVGTPDLAISLDGSETSSAIATGSASLLLELTPKNKLATAVGSASLSIARELARSFSASAIASVSCLRSTEKNAEFSAAATGTVSSTQQYIPKPIPAESGGKGLIAIRLGVGL